MGKGIAAKSNARTAGNAVFAMISQMIITLTPLITTLFVSRELGAENLGIFVHTLVMVQYFQMLANLGIVNYGARTLAEDADDTKKVSLHFWEIFGMQILTTAVFFAAYLIYILILPPSGKMMALVQILWLVGSFVDLNWFFYGIEEVKITAIRDLFTKLLTIAGILLLVRKGHNPLIVYTLIMGGTNLIGLVIMLPLIKRYVYWVRPSLKGILAHLKPNLILFIPLLATSVFHSMDKTMLGYMTSYEELGYYYNADKIINVPLSITNTLATVFLPRATILLQSPDTRHEARDYLKKSFELMILLSCAMAFGIAGCAKDFVPVFFGSGFESCTTLIYLFVPVLIIKSISTFFRMEYLVPTYREKLYITATFAGAAVNLIFNAFLIPRYGAAGAVAGTFLAELTVMLVQMKGVDRNVPMKDMSVAMLSYLVMSVLMFGFMKVIGYIRASALIMVVIEIMGGAAFYVVLCLLYWKYVSRNSEILELLTGMLRRKNA